MTVERVCDIKVLILSAEPGIQKYARAVITGLVPVSRLGWQGTARLNGVRGHDGGEAA